MGTHLRRSPLSPRSLFVRPFCLPGLPASSVNPRTYDYNMERHSGGSWKAHVHPTGGTVRSFFTWSAAGDCQPKMHWQYLLHEVPHCRLSKPLPRQSCHLQFTGPCWLPLRCLAGSPVAKWESGGAVCVFYECACFIHSAVKEAFPRLRDPAS